MAARRYHQQIRDADRFGNYRELKNHIAKALVPLLQTWLYASHKAEAFEKRDSELCEILTLQTYRGAVADLPTDWPRVLRSPDICPQGTIKVDEVGNFSLLGILRSSDTLLLHENQ